MGDFETNPHIGEEIKFNLDKLHKEMGINPNYIDIVKNLVAAGERLKAKAGKIGDTESGGKAGVTEEDLRIERELGELIKSFQDGSVFFSEEEHTEIPPKDAADVWICDPVSNTVSLKEGRVGFAITIAHKKEGKTDFAVVYDAARGRMFTAYEGKGAFVNGKKIEIPSSQVEKPRVAMGGANKELSAKFGSDELKNNGRFAKASGEAQSVALNTLKILFGEREGAVILAKDIFPHFATQLIVEEAGGKFTNLQGEQKFGYTDEVFVMGANEQLHQQILDFIQDWARQKGILK